MSLESLTQKLISIGIIGGIALAIITKVRKQSFKELFEDIRAALSSLFAKKEE